MISNPDGTVGNTISANKYMKDNNLQAKYKLLQSLSTNKNKLKVIDNVGGTGKSSSETANTTNANILNFLSKMEQFYFSPPSDNLWTVTIDLTNNIGNTSSRLPSLYNNIIAVNNMWNKKVGTSWKINLDAPKNTSKNTAKQFIEEFTGSSGVFLAQDVRFTPLAVNIANEPWTQGTNARSFLNFGMASHGRTDSKSLKISFLVSNWDIGDILFEPWIAAVAQKGLIEDGNSSIKATIIVSEFSSGLPKEYNGGEIPTMMTCRKQYVFYNCVPVSRGEVSKSYEMNEAGTFKKSIVDFRYDDYSIIYKY